MRRLTAVVLLAALSSVANGETLVDVDFAVIRVNIDPTHQDQDARAKVTGSATIDGSVIPDFAIDKEESTPTHAVPDVYDYDTETLQGQPDDTELIQEGEATAEGLIDTTLSFGKRYWPASEAELMLQARSKADTPYDEPATVEVKANALGKKTVDPQYKFDTQPGETVRAYYHLHIIMTENATPGTYQPQHRAIVEAKIGTHYHSFEKKQGDTDKVEWKRILHNESPPPTELTIPASGELERETLDGHFDWTHGDPPFKVMADCWANNGMRALRVKATATPTTTEDHTGTVTLYAFAYIYDTKRVDP